MVKMESRTGILTRLALAFLVGFGTAHAADLTDANATRQTYALFEALLAQMGNGVMFGHHHTTAYGVNWTDDNMRSDVKDVTGSYPAVYGWDFGHTGVEYRGAGELDYLAQLIKEAHARGGINTMSWHMDNPSTGGDYNDTASSITDMLPGGSGHAALLAKLDEFASFVLSLKDDNGEPIPIIFRPFHEMNGNWFWWGSNCGTPSEFIQLWQFTVNYLRDAKGVHNLLYAYSPDNCLGNPTTYLTRYPGDEYVDILGKDHYYSGLDGVPYWLGVQNLLDDLQVAVGLAASKGKVAALTEFGYRDIVDPTAVGLSYCPDTNWFMDRFLTPLKNDPAAKGIAFAMAWRNANNAESPGHYFVPYTGQANAADFVNFYNDAYTVFEDNMPNVYGNVLYVDHTATGAGDGSSWTNAYTTLDAALTNAISGDEIWVADGTYKPGSTFTVDKAVEIYGGFRGKETGYAGETSRSQRDWATNLTILSGDISGDDDPNDNTANRSDNIETVVTITHPAVRIDGFTINGGTSTTNAGGVSCQKTAVIDHCRLEYNTAVGQGGAIYVTGSSTAPTISNCVIRKNRADFGSAIHDVNDAQSMIRHCTIVQNTSTTGAAVTTLANTHIANTIIWDNGVNIFGAGYVGYSCVPGYGLNGNIQVDPIFVDLNGGDVRIRVGSPALDAGSSTWTAADDIIGVLRNDGSPDMGAYEGAAVPKITIKGKTIAIDNGDSTPSTDDDTEFGSVAGVGETHTHEFTIENTGDMPLSLTGTLVEVTGTEFMVTADPTSPIPADDATTFQITFNPSSPGLRTAVVTVTSDDATATPYTFKIQGTGVNIPPVAVGSSNSPVAAGGTAVLSASGSYDPDDWPVTPITYSWTFKSGPPGPEPTLTNVTGDWSQVSFTAADGAYIYDLTVSDGEDSDTVEVAINADALILDIPAQVTEGDGTVTGTIRTNRVLGAGEDLVVTLASNNTGKIQVPGSVTINGGTDSQTFTITVVDNTIDDPTATVRVSASATDWVSGNASIDVLNNDFYAKIVVSGNGRLIQNNSTTPSTSNFTDFDSVLLGYVTSRTFTISNVGPVQLNLTGGTVVQITGADASDFRVSRNPDTAIAPNDSTSFIITFYRTTLGTSTALVSIANSDSDEHPFTFTIQAKTRGFEGSVGGCSTGESPDLLPALLAVLAVLAMGWRIGIKTRSRKSEG